MMSLLLVPLLFAEGVALWASQGRFTASPAKRVKRGDEKFMPRIC
jgi:hypothetical protein